MGSIKDLKGSLSTRRPVYLPFFAQSAERDFCEALRVFVAIEYKINYPSSPKRAKGAKVAKEPK
jgi:hypothetical protein